VVCSICGADAILYCLRLIRLRQPIEFEVLLRATPVSLMVVEREYEWYSTRSICNEP
jgi:hypothetical protein